MAEPKTTSEQEAEAFGGMTPLSTSENQQEAKPNYRLPGRRAGDVVDNGLWPELPQRATKDFMGVDIAVEEIRVLFSREFNSDYAVVRCTDSSGLEFTTVCGGTVVVDKLKQLRDGNHLPITAKFTEVLPKRGGRAYLDIV